jgi:4-diphosphocytidyl-2-C-methyl-D-erythritol kinase
MFAPAKLNLTLHVTGRRSDGWHLLDSLVVFADAGDTVEPGDAPGLTLDGPFAAGLPTGPDNLVRRAAALAGAPDAALHLTKRLPPASGMGGGSSDAAATLRLLGAAPPVADLMALGADLPVCMAAPNPARMRGLGEWVQPVASLPGLWLVLVNPGTPLATPAVFRALARPDNPPMPDPLPTFADAAALTAWLATQRNDLEPPARALEPEIDAALAALAAQPGCALARMTGSGATCFGIFATRAARDAATAALARPGWWVAAAATLHARPSAERGAAG